MKTLGAFFCFFALSTNAFSVPVSECVVSIDTILDGLAPKEDSAENFGILPGPYTDGDKTNQFVQFSEKSPHTNVMFVLNRGRQELSVVKPIGNDKYEAFEGALPVSVRLTDRCQRNYDRRIVRGCDDKDLSNIRQATQSLLNQKSLVQLCALGEHRAHRFNQASIVKTLFGAGTAELLSAKNPISMADEFCRRSGFTHAIRYKIFDLGPRSFGSGPLGKHVLESFSPRSIARTSRLTYPEGGYPVFSDIECKSGEFQRLEQEGQAVVDSLNRGQEKDSESAGGQPSRATGALEN